MSRESSFNSSKSYHMGDVKNSTVFQGENIISINSGSTDDLENVTIVNQKDTCHQSGNFGIGKMSNGEIKGDAKVAGVINKAEQQNLADAAREIRQLLEQLSETYPTSTNKEKILVIGEAVEQIGDNPTLKAKVINALKAEGTETFNEAVNHPLVNILLATIKS